MIIPGKDLWVQFWDTYIIITYFNDFVEKFGRFADFCRAVSDDIISTSTQSRC